jgi:thiol:disulfide interchange protein DsbA
MKKIAFIAALLLVCAGPLQAQVSAEPFTEGVHYVKFEQAATAGSSETIMVTEIFSYGCHACNDFEPYMQSWKTKQAEDVKLNRIPVGFGRAQWEMLAKGYIIAEIMGIEEESHVPMMDAIWKERKQMRSLNDLADFYSEHGAEREKFLALENSFMLNMRQKQNNDKLGIYSPRGTPTMVVNGKYKIQTGQSVPNYQAMLAVVDFLVTKERAEASAAGTAQAE